MNGSRLIHALLRVSGRPSCALTSRMVDDGACEQMCERVEVVLRDQDAHFRLPGGVQFSASQDTVLKSEFLRTALYSSEHNGKMFVNVPKGCLLAWVHCTMALKLQACSDTAAELCLEIPTQQIGLCIRVMVPSS